MAEKAILYDASRCIACRACQVACKQWWELPAVATSNRGTYENPAALSAQTWNRIRFFETSPTTSSVRWLFARQACMHCTTAVCVWVCPSYARTYDALGFVTIDQERCIGCGRCVEYCPFAVPSLGSANVSPRVAVQMGTPRSVAYKCKFCEDRVKDGLAPSCVKTCPTGALQFGERADLIKLGSARVAALESAYPGAYLYGEKELGGLHVMYVITEAPATMGLPESPRVGTYPKFDENAFPDWYAKAVASGELPAFPPGARREWYLQPQLAPAPAPPEPAWPISQSVSPTGGWGIPAMWSWLGIGAVGGIAALGWTIRRRIAQQEESKKLDKVKPAG